MQEGAHEMGQALLQLVHEWTFTGIWVSHAAKSPMRVPMGHCI